MQFCDAWAKEELVDNHQGAEGGILMQESNMQLKMNDNGHEDEKEVDDFEEREVDMNLDPHLVYLEKSKELIILEIKVHIYIALSYFS